METTDHTVRRSPLQIVPHIRITGYHAHLYYDADSIDIARHVRLLAKESFPDIELGRIHERPVGPHPVWSTQLAFEPYMLPEIFPWLLLNRRGLDVFLHPVTGDDWRDHTDLAVWIGKRYQLNLDGFRAR